MKCDVAKTHPATDEFSAKDLDPLILARVRHVFGNVPLNADGNICAPCVQWLSDRRGLLV